MKTTYSAVKSGSGYRINMEITFDNGHKTSGILGGNKSKKNFHKTLESAEMAVEQKNKKAKSSEEYQMMISKENGAK